MISVFIHLVIIFSLAFWWLKCYPENGKLVYWFCLALKLSAGLVLGYVYSTHYTDSDTFNFFQDSLRLAEMAKANWREYVAYLWFEKEPAFSGENRTLFFVKLVSVFTLLAQGNYWVVSLYFSLFSFAACWWFVWIIGRYYPNVKFAAILAFLLFPSSVFWSSGIIKESAAMTMLYVLLGIFLTVWQHKKFSWMQSVVLLIATWVLWSLKYYYAAVFFPVALSALLTRWFIQERMRPSAVSAYREFVLLLVLMMVFVFIVTFVHPNFYPQRILEVVVENYEAFRDKSDPEKMAHFHNLKPKVGSFLLNAPWALVSGLFRPFVWEASNIFSFLVSVGNIILLGFTIFALRHFRRLTASPDRLLLFALIVYCASLCIFLTLSAPNFGTYVRYRVGFFPLFILLISLGLPLERWIKKITG
ncbi:MAG: hypothetical protein KF803_03525 [Cyclobacteriaceae bacterium]|nr:hypothetical protein [Cyclobacteriaceae bacterium]